MRNFALVFLIVGFFSAAASAEEILRDFNKVDAVVIRNILGEARVSPSKDGVAHFRLNKILFSDRCALKFEQVGTTVEVKVEKTGWFSGLSGKDCQLNVEAQIPSSVNSVIIGQTAGMVEVKSITAKSVEVDAVSATTNIDAEVARVSAKSVSGAISVHSPSAKDLFMKSVSGELELDTESGKPAIEMVTVSGSAVMRASQVPQITFKSVSGRLISKAMTGTGDGAPVHFQSVSGDLTIQ